MKKKTLLCLCLGSMLGLYSCIDNDYDLSEDIDLTMQVGGIELPTNNSGDLKLGDILDLDADAIVQTDANGVYQLTKTGEPTTFSYDLERIDINSSNIEPFRMEFVMPSEDDIYGHIPSISTPLGTLSGKELLSYLQQNNPSKYEEIMNTTYTSSPLELKEDIETLKYDFNVPAEVIALRHISFEGLTPTLTFQAELPQNSSIKLQGVKAVFPETLEHDDKASSTNCTWDETTHALELFDNLEVSNSLHPSINTSFAGVKCDYNNTANGSIYNFSEDVTLKGAVTVTSTIGTLLDYCGKTCTLVVNIDLGKASVKTVEVKVNPTIAPSTSDINIDNLPEFLNNDEVKVILQQPAVKLNVVNHTPVGIFALGTLTPYLNNKQLDNQVAQIVTPLSFDSNATTNYCIYAGKLPSWANGMKNNVVQNLGHLVERIPDHINACFDANADSETWISVDLGQSYTASLNYELVCPLAFEKGSQIVYTHTYDGWNGDINDANIDVKKIVVKGKVNNSTSLDEIDLSIEPIGLNGKKPNIKVEDIKGLKDGDEFTINITSEDGFKDMDGIELRATAKVTQVNSKPLNANDVIRLSDVTVKAENILFNFN